MVQRCPDRRLPWYDDGMFGIQGWEWLVILVIALLVFGARLPQVARSLGKSINEFKKGVRDIENDVNKPVDTAAQKDTQLPPAAPKT